MSILPPPAMVSVGEAAAGVVAKLAARMPQQMMIAGKPVRTIKHGEIITEPGVYRMPIDWYHAQCCDGPSISSSGLRTIFCDSAMEYWINSSLNPNRLPEKDKEAYVLGRATHHLVLGEDDFHKHFIERPDELAGYAWNSNRTEHKRWLADQALAGITVLTPALIESIRGMAGLLPWQEGLEDSGLINHAAARAALSGGIELSIIWRDAETGIWLKTRPDSIPSSTDFVDLKTAAAVDSDALSKAIYEDRRYDMQALLAAAGMKAVLGIDLTSFAFLFVRKTPPYTVKLVELYPADLFEIEADLRTALHAFAWCLEHKRWPGPDGSQRDGATVYPRPWARKNAEIRRAILDQEIAA